MCTLRQVGLVTVTVQMCENFLRPSPLGRQEQMPIHPRKGKNNGFKK